jgi:hypothetical protein
MEGEVQQQVNNQQGSVQRGQYNNSRGYRGGYKGHYNKVIKITLKVILNNMLELQK